MNFLEDENTGLKDMKILVLLGDNIVDGKNRDGDVDVLEDDKNDPYYYHALCMDYYLKTHFKDKKRVQNCNRNGANAMFYELTREKAIVVAEDTSIGHPNTLLVYMPRTLSEKQKQNIKLLQEKIQKENYEVNLLYDFKVDRDGFLQSKNKRGNGRVFDTFIEDKKGLPQARKNNSASRIEENDDLSR